MDEGQDLQEEHTANKKVTVHKKLIIAVIVIVVLSVVVGLLLFLLKDTDQTTEEPVAETEIEQVNTEVADSIEEVSVNPIDEAPNLNPTQNTNPFEDSYTNPFE